MKSLFGRFANRVLSGLGLGLDFSVDLRERFFSEITESLYLGARPNAERVEELKAAGITHVVSCLKEDERAGVAFLREDFEHLFLSVHDGIDQDIAGNFSQFFAFAATAVAGDPRTKLLVHCEVGVSRSPSLVIAWLMKTERMSFFDAVSHVRSKRFQVLPNIGFASQLQRLEHELQPKSMNDEPSSLAKYLRQICNAPVEMEVLDSALERHGYDAAAALTAIFGGEIPRVVQGVRK